jgi:hypothetical protein
VGFDIAFPIPKGLSLSDSDADDAEAYYTVDPYTNGARSSQWGGKGAALQEACEDAMRKTMEQIAAEARTRVGHCGERSSRGTGEMEWVEFSHRDQPAPSNKPPKTTLWVNGVRITPKLWKRLHAMSKEEYEAFWDKRLKDMWSAPALAAK